MRCPLQRTRTGTRTRVRSPSITSDTAPADPASLALGAAPADVARMIVSQGVKLAVVGSIPGVLGAYAATIVVAMALVLAVTLAGSFVPAVRAVRVEPMLALRAE